MIRAILIVSLSLCWLNIFAQGEKQIQSRRIKTKVTRVESIQKEKRELTFSTTHYDGKGRETEVNYYNTDSVCVKSEQFQYNRKGKTTHHTTVDSIKKITTEILYTYDQWNRLREKQVKENSNMRERTIYEYDNFDNKIKEVVLNGKEEIKKDITYTYDKKGMLLRKTTLNGSGKVIYDKTNTYDY